MINNIFRILFFLIFQTPCNFKEAKGENYQMKKQKEDEARKAKNLAEVGFSLTS